MNPEQSKEFEKKLLEKRRGIIENPSRTSLLALIDSALLRIRAGAFGDCLHCGREIGNMRLNAIPWTRYCITCQELLEQFGR